MSSYCAECGAPANKFADSEGNPLLEPLCDECFNFQEIRFWELVEEGAIPLPDEPDIPDSSLYELPDDEEE
jgi:hypothetical protein